MIVRCTQLVWFTLALLASLAMARPAAAQQVFDGLVPGEAMVRVPDPLGGKHDIQTFVDEFFADHGVTLSVVETFERTYDNPFGDTTFYMYRLSFDPLAGGVVEAALDPEDATSPYVLSGSIRWGELLYGSHTPEGFGGSTGSSWTASVAPGALANQYSLEQLHVAEAHGVSTGEGVTVAILDTGVDGSHDFLSGRVLSSGYNFITDSTNTSDIGDNIDNDDDGETDEMVGHGTFVAGIVSLVAPDAWLLPVVVLNSDGRSDLWTVAQGMFYAIDHGVEVINMSLGSTYNSSAVEDALDLAENLGIVVVSAGGNQNAGDSGGDAEEFPAAESSGFGVAALDDLGVKASFSNYNEKFFISAPGESIEHAGFPDGFDPERTIYSILPDNEIGIWRGTSFATPFVAGSAALIRSQHPEWASNPSTTDLISIMMSSTAVNIYNQNPMYEEDDQLGAGRLDVGAAVALGPVAPGLGDLNADGVVGPADLSIVLGSWGATHSSADMDGSGVVGPGDLAIVLGRWGA